MSMKSCFLLASLSTFFWPTASVGQLNSARWAVDSIASHAKGTVGVAVIDLLSGDTLTVHANAHFPMQSVYKFPLALAILDRVDKGSRSLSEVVHIREEDLRPNTWSPLKRVHPTGDVDLPLDSLLRYTVSSSDNNGCDILFGMLGGPAVVHDYVRSLGIMDIAIVSTEQEMHRDPDLQFRNWSTPLAMAKLLQRMFSGGILSDSSRAYLLDLMAGSVTAPQRLNGSLPPGVQVAHKSGSSGTDGAGVAAATNDVGILTLPSGRSLAVAVFITNSDASDAERDAVIAAIARAVWDSYHP